MRDVIIVITESHNDKSLRPGSLRTNQPLMRVTVRVVARVSMRVVGNLISYREMRVVVSPKTGFGM